MEFPHISLNDLRQELQHIPASGEDQLSKEIEELIDEALKPMRLAKPEEFKRTLASLLAKDSNYLDVIRLFTGDSQDVIANKLGKALSTTGNYGTLKRKVAANSGSFAEALVRMGVGDLIRRHFQRSWSLRDVLLERYRMSRGRAIAGQQRGRALEVEVREILNALSVGYQARCTFRGRPGKSAKCDFAIPKADNPKIVIEVKAYEATGSKQTDVLGDIAKIVEARTPHMYFFVVTDGLGWLNRISDLRALVDFQNEGTIDMIFTVRRLKQLGKAIQHIMTREV